MSAAPEPSASPGSPTQPVTQAGSDLHTRDLAHTAWKASGLKPHPWEETRLCTCGWKGANQATQRLLSTYCMPAF